MEYDVLNPQRCETVFYETVWGAEIILHYFLTLSLDIVESADLSSGLLFLRNDLGVNFVPQPIGALQRRHQLMFLLAIEPRLLLIGLSRLV
jgi:hypothetical protein